MPKYRDIVTGQVMEFDHEPTMAELESRASGTSTQPPPTPVQGERPWAPTAAEPAITKALLPMAGALIGGKTPAGKMGSALGATTGQAYGDIYNMIMAAATGDPGYGNIPTPSEEAGRLLKTGATTAGLEYAVPGLTRLVEKARGLMPRGSGLFGGAGLGYLFGHPQIGAAVGTAADVAPAVGRAVEYVGTPAKSGPLAGDAPTFRALAERLGLVKPTFTIDPTIRGESIPPIQSTGQPKVTPTTSAEPSGRIPYARPEPGPSPSYTRAQRQEMAEASRAAREASRVARETARQQAEEEADRAIAEQMEGREAGPSTIVETQKAGPVTMRTPYVVPEPQSAGVPYQPPMAPSHPTPGNAPHPAQVPPEAAVSPTPETSAARGHTAPTPSEAFPQSINQIEGSNLPEAWKPFAAEPTVERMAPTASHSPSLQVFRGSPGDVAKQHYDEIKRLFGVGEVPEQGRAIAGRAFQRLGQAEGGLTPKQGQYPTGGAYSTPNPIPSPSGVPAAQERPSWIQTQLDLIESMKKRSQ